MCVFVCVWNQNYSAAPTAWQLLHFLSCRGFLSEDCVFLWKRGREMDSERLWLTAGVCGWRVIHIQFPPPSVTPSVFVVAEMDHRQTHTHSFFLLTPTLLFLAAWALHQPLNRQCCPFSPEKSFLTLWQYQIYPSFNRSSKVNNNISFCPGLVEWDREAFSPLKSLLAHHLSLPSETVTNHSWKINSLVWCDNLFYS